MKITETVLNLFYRSHVPEKDSGTVAIGVRLHVAGTAGSQSEFGTSEALHEGVGPLLLLQQTPVSPFPQPHHQVYQSVTKAENGKAFGSESFWSSSKELYRHTENKNKAKTVTHDRRTLSPSHCTPQGSLRMTSSETIIEVCTNTVPPVISHDHTFKGCVIKDNKPAGKNFTSSSQIS